ncbi:MAG: MFS transporter [Candidatus Eremiobacteraeota bacterium]|nr:MFS transporter [Candidatus Eremiobacteraeota bacterium]
MKQQRGLLLYANSGLFCDGYILSSIGLALIAIAPRFHPDAVATGALGGATLVGILVGAPLFGHVTDRFGRRILMIADLCVFAVACIAQAFAGSLGQLIALRFILGLAIGADYPIAAALIGESVPSDRRGAAVNSMQVAWFLGAAVAYAVGYALLNLTGAQSWRWILASPAVFAAAGLLLRSTAPESPLWIASRNSGALQRTPFVAIFDPRHRGALAFVSAMWLLQVVPLFAIYAFAPAVLAALGLNDQRSPAGSIAITTAFLVGSILSLPLVERWGRRPLCIAGFVVGVVAFSLLLIPNPQLVILAFVAYAVGIGAAAGLELTYPVELFPTPIRASATGFAAAVSRIGAALGTFALPVVLARYGVGSVVVGSIALCAAGLIVAIRWAPETKGINIS